MDGRGRQLGYERQLVVGPCPQRQRGDGRVRQTSDTTAAITLDVPVAVGTLTIGNTSGAARRELHLQRREHVDPRRLAPAA